MKNSSTYLRVFSLLLVLALGLAACAPQATQAPAATQPQAVTQAPAQPAATQPAAKPTAMPTVANAGTKDIILATTTSTQDTGLLDVLVPDFEQKSGFTVKTVAVGTGQALKMGQDCNADVLLVHAPTSEKDFMSNGYGDTRKLVMHNDFIIVGPAADPAGIKGTASASDALKKIAAANVAAASAPFISRGDDSGTNKAELALWKAAGIIPQGDWYQESGQGMGATLKIASEKNAYTLTDRGTYLANKSDLGLEPVVEGDTSLLNVYHVITVNPAKCSGVNVAGAKAFSDYMVAADTQAVIGKFGADKYGQPLFFPDANKTDADLGLK